MRIRMSVLGSAVALAAGALAPVQIASAASAAAAPSYDWVALGDSYTAGVIPAAGEVFEFPRDGCERTDQSYPQVIDRELGPAVDLLNVSCGAATIDDITFRAQQPIGRHLPPFSEDPDYPFPSVPPQSAAVNSDTDVITIGVGGNTLGFADILLHCLQRDSGSEGKGTPCRDDLADTVTGRLDRVSRDYSGMLATLHERAEQAKVVTVGYPAVIPQDTAKCRDGDWEQFGSITPGDLDWLRDDVLEPLNTVIKRTAGEYGDAFVDLYSSSRNHSVCDSDKWVEGIFAKFPNEVAFVHPNTKGHANAARKVSTAVRSALGIG
ncbi:SGNH/GDSL hydrolase family protein [Streptomyces sp. NPDC002746]